MKTDERRCPVLVSSFFTLHFFACSLSRLIATTQRSISLSIHHHQHTLPRRTFLKGTGISLALPWLDAMSTNSRSVTTAGDISPNETPRRAVFCFFGLGINAHHNHHLPAMLAGGSRLGIKHQGHLVKEDVRLGNLWITVFDRMQVPLPKNFQGGEADGVIKELV